MNPERAFRRAGVPIEPRPVSARTVRSLGQGRRTASPLAGPRPTSVAWPLIEESVKDRPIIDLLGRIVQQLRLFQAQLAWAGSDVVSTVPLPATSKNSTEAITAKVLTSARASAQVLLMSPCDHHRAMSGPSAEAKTAHRLVQPVMHAWHRSIARQRNASVVPLRASWPVQGKRTFWSRRLIALSYAVLDLPNGRHRPPSRAGLGGGGHGEGCVRTAASFHLACR